MANIHFNSTYTAPEDCELYYRKAEFLIDNREAEIALFFHKNAKINEIFIGFILKTIIHAEIRGKTRIILFTENREIESLFYTNNLHHCVVKHLTATF